MTDIPTDRTRPECRAHIRALAESPRKQRPERKHRARGGPAKASRPYPWPIDADIDHD